MTFQQRAGAARAGRAGGRLRHQYLSPGRRGRRGARNPRLKVEARASPPLSPGTRAREPRAPGAAHAGQGQHNPRTDGETEAQAEERSEPQALQRERGQESSQAGCRGARSSCSLPAVPRRPPAPGPGTPRWLSTCTRGGLEPPSGPGTRGRHPGLHCASYRPLLQPPSAQGARRPPASSPHPTLLLGAGGSPGPSSTSSPCAPRPSVIRCQRTPGHFPGQLFERTRAERERGGTALHRGAPGVSFNFLAACQRSRP